MGPGFELFEGWGTRRSEVVVSEEAVAVEQVDLLDRCFLRRGTATSSSTPSGTTSTPRPHLLNRRFVNCRLLQDAETRMVESTYGSQSGLCTEDDRQL